MSNLESTQSQLRRSVDRNVWQNPSITPCELFSIVEVFLRGWKTLPWIAVVTIAAGGLPGTSHAQAVPPNAPAANEVKKEAVKDKLEEHKPADPDTGKSTLSDETAMFHLTHPASL